jgi:hypothetical protein
MIAKQIKGRKFCGAKVSVEPVAVIALAFAMLLALTMPAGAASPAGKVLMANVPFDFYCGAKLFPAGTYYFEDGTAPGTMISIQSVSGTPHAWFFGVPGGSTTGFVRKPSLLFNRYPDGKSYLREVRNPFSLSSYIPASRIERKSATTLMGEAKPTPIVLSARVR